MRWQRKIYLLAVVLAAIGLFASVRSAGASQYFDNQRGEIAARMSTQNTFQHNDVNSINWVQWRNELRFDLKYDLIQEGTGGDLGPLKTLKFNILWRGRYDPVYELRQSYKDRDYDRANFEFPEGKTPRELFFDVGFGGALENLSLRIGKQQVVWGESDLFRSLDVVNPLDLRQNGFVGEDFADFRQPLWILKALYQLGDLGPALNGANLEMFVSPNSRPQAFLTNVLIGETYKLHVDQMVQGTKFNRNVSEPTNQVRHPWELLRVGATEGDSPAIVQQGDGSLADFMYRIKNDIPPSELSTNAFMAGVRLLGTTYGNAFFTLNYLFKRTDGASAAVAFTQALDPSAPGTNTIQADVIGRAITQSLTPDTDGNGIPDGQDEQIRNCIRSKSPAGMTTRNAGEVMLDPRLSQIILGQPVTFTGPWHGSVYSDPAHPELATGVRAGTLGVPAGANQLTTDHVAYKPVLPLGGLTAVDGLPHASFCLDIPVFHPWTHIIGFTTTYNDFDYTGLIFRLEQSYSTKEPRQMAPNTPERLLNQKAHCGDAPCTGPDADRFNAFANSRDFETRGRRYTGVWRSMVGFDYLRALNPDFGHKLSNPLLRSLITDQWFFTFQFLNEYDVYAANVAHSASYTDRFQHFNPFFTVSGTGFFLHQTFRPTWAVAYDTNQQVPLFFVQGAYFLSPKLELRIGEIIYAGSKRDQDNNFLYDYADRDTLYFRLTYYIA